LPQSSAALRVACPPMALADEFDGLLVDLDGVVWIGRELLPGAVETLTVLLGRGMPIVFVTNNSVKQPHEYAERLREAGIAAADERVVTGGATHGGLRAARGGR